MLLCSEQHEGEKVLSYQHDAGADVLIRHLEHYSKSGDPVVSPTPTARRTSCVGTEADEPRPLVRDRPNEERQTLSLCILPKRNY